MSMLVRGYVDLCGYVAVFGHVLCAYVCECVSECMCEFVHVSVCLYVSGWTSGHVCEC